jgi:aryl-alcohol dehydrogenase-like predicted oxidoreductase
MEFRTLGRSGFKVPLLSFGTMTFGEGDGFFRAFGSTDARGATRLVDICLEAGANMFDTADVYSHGQSEEVVGTAIAGRRDRVIISTKASFRMGPGPNDVGNSRHHLIQACEASLRRLNTDYIDVYHLHGYDALTSPEETLGALETLVTSGKVRCLGCSNFSGWHLMKSLATSDRYGWPRMAAHQAYYSLVNRDFEWELMPLAADQQVSTIVWSPLGWGRLTGKVRRGQPLPAVSRLEKTAQAGPQVPDEHLYRVVDALDGVAAETGKSVSQVALNWVMHRPTVASVIMGARTEEQLRQNLGAVGWRLAPEHVARLDAASAVPMPYPYWHQQGVAPERNPLPASHSLVLPVQ